MNQPKKIDPITVQFKSDEELLELSLKDLTAKERFILAKELGDRAIIKGENDGKP